MTDPSTNPICVMAQSVILFMCMTDPSINPICMMAHSVTLLYVSQSNNCVHFPSSLYISSSFYVTPTPSTTRVIELSKCFLPTQFYTSTPPANTSYVSILFFPYPTLTLCTKHSEKFWSQHLEKFWSQHLENFGFQHLENLLPFPQLLLWFKYLGLGLVTNSKSNSV